MKQCILLILDAAVGHCMQNRMQAARLCTYHPINKCSVRTKSSFMVSTSTFTYLMFNCEKRDVGIQTVPQTLQGNWENWRAKQSEDFRKFVEVKEEATRHIRSYPAGYLYEKWKSSFPDFDRYDVQLAFWCFFN